MGFSVAVGATSLQGDAGIPGAERAPELADGHLQGAFHGRGGLDFLTDAGDQHFTFGLLLDFLIRTGVSYGDGNLVGDAFQQIGILLL